MFRSLIDKISFKKWNKIFYVVENSNWSIKWDGKYITSNLKKRYNVEARIITNINGIKNQILHFGSRGLYVPEAWKNIDTTNKIIYTWFHGNKSTPKEINHAMIESLPEAVEICDFIHTTNNKSKDLFIEWGIPENKIVVIPLGVDLNLFKPADETIKENLKKEFNIPEGHLCIGSFQKDGEGWNEGNEPKWEKGPDIFCDAVIKLAETFPIFVILIGPARGYVKKRLNGAGIPFYHEYLKNFEDIPKYYHLLDMYIVSSRDEGGPKAVLESMASGIPLITTDVGIAQEIINHGKNGYKVDIEDVDGIVRFSTEILENKEKKSLIVSNALETVKSYSWEKIAQLYYEKMYSKLLRKKNGYRI